MNIEDKTHGTWVETVDLIEERQTYSQYRKDMLKTYINDANYAKIKGRTKKESRQYYINSMIILNDLCHHLMLNSNQDHDYGISHFADENGYIFTVMLYIFKNREALEMNDTSQAYCVLRLDVDKSGEAAKVARCNMKKVQR